VSGGTIYFGTETPAYGLDVLGSGSSGVLLPDMAVVNSAIQEPLFRMDREGSLIPVLGLSAVPEEDGRSWIIALRKGVVFQDGTPFTADAVVHHWGRMLDPENGFRGRKLFEPIRRVSKIDAFTVRFELAYPWLPFLKVISDELLLSSFIPSPAAVEAGSHDRKPIGTGPFKFHSWNRDDHYVVLKNNRYWRQGTPVLDKIVFRTVPDHQTRYASLLAGELDAIAIDRGHIIDKALKTGSMYLCQSQGSGAEIVMANTNAPPLDDPRVRRALALANDQRRHVELVYGNTIPVIEHPFGEWFRCRGHEYPDHDLEEAARLIAEYGRPVELECLHSNTTRGRQTGELLQQLYKKIGVVLRPVGLSSGAVVMKVINKDYQLTTWRMLSANDLGPHLYRSFHSGSPANYSGYRSPVMDSLLEEQRLETDPDRRTRILCRIAARLNQDAPIFYRGGRRYNILAKNTIRDLTDRSGVRVNLSTAWIDDAVRFNLRGFAIEEKAAVPQIECPDPGDTEAVKQAIAGTWKGTDSWGASITITFEDDTVTGVRAGSTPQAGKYVLCQDRIFIHGRAKVEMAVTADKRVGQWERAGYTGDFTLTKTD